MDTWFDSTVDEVEYGILPAASRGVTHFTHHHFHTGQTPLFTSASSLLNPDITIDHTQQVNRNQTNLNFNFNYLNSDPNRNNHNASRTSPTVNLNPSSNPNPNTNATNANGSSSSNTNLNYNQNTTTSNTFSLLGEDSEYGQIARHHPVAEQPNHSLRNSDPYTNTLQSDNFFLDEPTRPTGPTDNALLSNGSFINRNNSFNNTTSNSMLSFIDLIPDTLELQSILNDPQRLEQQRRELQRYSYAPLSTIYSNGNNRAARARPIHSPPPIFDQVGGFPSLPRFNTLPTIGQFLGQAAGSHLNRYCFHHSSNRQHDWFGQHETEEDRQWNEKLLNGIEYVNKVSLHLMCGICLCPVFPPIVAQCRHMFCYKCIERLMAHSSSSAQECPICRQKISKSTLKKGSYPMMSILGELEVKCPNYICCKMITPRSKIFAHFKQCFGNRCDKKHDEGDCQYAPYEKKLKPKLESKEQEKANKGDRNFLQPMAMKKRKRKQKNGNSIFSSFRSRFGADTERKHQDGSDEAEQGHDYAFGNHYRDSNSNNNKSNYRNPSKIENESESESEYESQRMVHNRNPKYRTGVKFEYNHQNADSN